MRRPRSCLCKCLLAHCAFWRMFPSAQLLERTSQRSTRSKSGQPRAHSLSYTASPTGSQSRHASVILRVIARCAYAMHLQLIARDSCLSGGTLGVGILNGFGACIDTEQDTIACALLDGYDIVVSGPRACCLMRGTPSALPLTRSPPMRRAAAVAFCVSWPRTGPSTM